MHGSSADGGIFELLTCVYSFQYVPALSLYFGYTHLKKKKKFLFWNNVRFTHSCRKSYREIPHILYSVPLTGIIWLNSGTMWQPGDCPWHRYGSGSSHPSCVHTYMCVCVHRMPLCHTRTYFMAWQVLFCNFSTNRIVQPTKRTISSADRVIQLIEAMPCTRHFYKTKNTRREEKENLASLPWDLGCLGKGRNADNDRTQWVSAKWKRPFD